MVDLRKSECKQVESSLDNELSFYMLSCKELKKYCDDVLGNKTPRFLLDRIMDFEMNPTNLKICILYGLRRTGKIILMLHTIQKLDCYSKCVYIFAGVLGIRVAITIFL